MRHSPVTKKRKHTKLHFGQVTKEKNIFLNYGLYIRVLKIEKFYKVNWNFNKLPSEVALQLKK